MSAPKDDAAYEKISLALMRAVPGLSSDVMPDAMALYLVGCAVSLLEIRTTANRAKVLGLLAELAEKESKKIEAEPPAEPAPPSAHRPDVTEFTERQRFAFEHPRDCSGDTTKRVHPGATVTNGKWKTTLDVGNGPRSPWLWCASISRVRVGQGTYKVRRWKPEWKVEADALLAELLKGVGGPDLDMAASIARSGADVGELTARHLYRPLTYGEVLLLDNSLRNQDAE